jgi:Flp pilus assembly protein TadD
VNLRRLLAAALVCASFVAAASAQDAASPTDEKTLRDRVETTDGKARGAASADLAKLLESESRWSEAASAWRQARKLRGDVVDLEGEARALLAFAEEVAAQGESGGAVSASFEDAKTALRRAREAGSKSVEVALGLARCAEISGDSEARIAELTNACAAAPNDVRPTWALAAALISAGRKDEGLALYVKLSDAHPKDANLALAAYTAARTAGDEARALSSVKRALDAAPENIPAWNSLWYVFAPQQRWGELAEASVEIAKAHPDGVSPAHYAGVACARARRFDEALTWLEKAWNASKDKGDPDARCEAARILLTEKNDRARAETLLTDAFALSPSNEQANSLMFFLAKRFADEGMSKKASQLFEVIARARPKDQIAQNNYANSLRFAGRVDECEKTYLAMIEQFPNDAQIRNDYALLLDSVGRNDDAKKVLLAAHEVDPMNNDSMENLAFLARAKGDRTEALKWFHAAYAVAVAKNELTARHRITLDDQRWPLPPLAR